MSPELLYMYFNDKDETHVKVDNFVCDIYSLGIIILYLGFAQMTFRPKPSKMHYPLSDNPIEFQSLTDASLLGPDWIRQIWESNLTELANRYPEVPKP
jgi:hypothetical protein